MPEIKIPNLNNRSRQYLFKNKLSIKRKSKSKLLRESLLMFISAFILFFINYFIPQKKILINSFIQNFYKIYITFLDLIKYFYQILLVAFIFSSVFVAILLIIGAFYRLYRISTRKTSKFKF